MDLGKMTSSPMKVKIGEKEFELSPITIGDLGDFENWIKERRLQTFLASIKGRDIDKDIVTDAISKIVTKAFTFADFSSELSNMNGIRYIVWKSISKKDKKFTLEATGALENLQDIFTVIDNMSGIGRSATVPLETETTEPKPASSGDDGSPG